MFLKVCHSCCLVHIARDIRYLILFHSEGVCFCRSLGCHYGSGEAFAAVADGNGLLRGVGWVSVTSKRQIRTAQSSELQQWATIAVKASPSPSVFKDKSQADYSPPPSYHLCNIHIILINKFYQYQIKTPRDVLPNNSAALFVAPIV